MNIHTESHISKKNIEEELQPTAYSYQILTEQREFISIKRMATKVNFLMQVMKVLWTQFPPSEIGETNPDVDHGHAWSVLAVDDGMENSNFYKEQTKILPPRSFIPSKSL